MRAGATSLFATVRMCYLVITCQNHVALVLIHGSLTFPADSYSFFDIRGVSVDFPSHHLGSCYCYSCVLLGICFGAAILNILATRCTTHLCSCNRRLSTASRPNSTTRNNQQCCQSLMTVFMSLTSSITTPVLPKERRRCGSAQSMSYVCMSSIQVRPGLF